MATAIGKHVEKLTRSAFGARGFAHAQILTHWDSIVGAELAEFCQPERLRWPPGQERVKHQRRRLGGTLTIRVEGPIAVELQHESPRLIDRLNTYYGYQAVTEIRIVQGPIDRGSAGRTRKDVLPRLSDAGETALRRQTSHVEDEALRNALTRLGRGVLATAERRRKTRSSDIPRTSTDQCQETR